MMRITFHVQGKGLVGTLQLVGTTNLPCVVADFNHCLFWHAMGPASRLSTDGSPSPSAFPEVNAVILSKWGSLKAFQVGAHAEQNTGTSTNLRTQLRRRLARQLALVGVCRNLHLIIGGCTVMRHVAALGCRLH
jgi:hypothetical protein